MGALARKPYIMPPLGDYAAVATRLKIDNVSLRYRSPKGELFTALDRVSLEVPDRQAYLQRVDPTLRVSRHLFSAPVDYGDE